MVSSFIALPSPLTGICRPSASTVTGVGAHDVGHRFINARPPPPVQLTFVAAVASGAPAGRRLLLNWPAQQSARQPAILADSPSAPPARPSTSPRRTDTRRDAGALIGGSVCVAEIAPRLATASTAGWTLPAVPADGAYLFFGVLDSGGMSSRPPTGMSTGRPTACAWGGQPHATAPRSCSSTCAPHGPTADVPPLRAAARLRVSPHSSPATSLVIRRVAFSAVNPCAFRTAVTT